ncbi:hypothetical protein DV735_g5204, partial [Chaetothyriales sp. CBS 134920]
MSHSPTKFQLNVLAQTLAKLHQPGNPLILANVYDGASARVVASHHPWPTQAIATASYAIAASQGVEDDDLTWEQNRVGIANVVAGMRQAGKWGVVPLSADLQDGYGGEGADGADGVGATIREAIEQLGVVGANLEDYDAKKQVLRTKDEAVARIRAAVAAARAVGVPDFVVNARTDLLGFGGSLADVVDRGRAFLDAGATTVFVWGVGKYTLTQADVTSLVDAFAGRLAVQPGALGIPLLKQLGVARISVGPAVWRKALAEFDLEAVKVMES